MTEFIISFCTTSTLKEARKIATALVSEKLAACVNILEGITSIYEWKNELCTDKECLLIIKSRNELFNDIKNKITSLHSYEVPEIISIPVDNGSDAYLNWIKENSNFK